jgi:alginate O-acetyltransferase complex protein AlgI
MDFTSVNFLILFLPIFTLVFLVAGQKSKRIWVITIASILFLAWGQWFALAWLSGILLTGYLIAQKLNNNKSTRYWLWLGIGINLMLLVFFKMLTAYGIAWFGRFGFPAHWLTSIDNLAIPIGLSYVTFQTIAYLVDVWRGSIPAETNLLDFAAYLLFFPKLVSGPLMRYKSFKEQLSNLTPGIEDIASGLRRFLLGFIKRTLIANELRKVVNAAFGLNSPNLEPWVAWLVLLAYTLQIFFDFSGYTDMALGLAQMTGVKLPENFNYPYIAQSLSDFWRRWHISLSTWFREYVFYPLERRRLKWAGQQINIVVVFLLTGLWHGFQPHYILWGLLHGAAIALESAGLGRFLKIIWRPFRHVYTLAIILLGWVFFRSPNLRFAFGFLGRLIGNRMGITHLPFSQTTPLPFIEPTFLLSLAFGLLFSLPVSSICYNLRKTGPNQEHSVSIFPQLIEDLFLIALFVLGFAALLGSRFAPNIYAKF